MKGDSPSARSRLKRSGGKYFDADPTEEIICTIPESFKRSLGIGLPSLPLL